MITLTPASFNTLAAYKPAAPEPITTTLPAVSFGANVACKNEGNINVAGTNVPSCFTNFLLRINSRLTENYHFFGIRQSYKRQNIIFSTATL